MSIVTSNELLQNILVSINTALQEPDIHNDIRSSLIDQYEKIVSFIREGYQYSEEDLKDLPTTIRVEVQAQLNEEKVALDTSTQILITTVNDELTQLQSLPETIRTETNTKLNDEITTFQTEFQTLTQSINDEFITLQNEIAQQQDENISYMGNNILLMKQDLLGLKLNIQGE